MLVADHEWLMLDVSRVQCVNWCIIYLFSNSPLMQSLLSGDFKDLLSELLEACSVEERGQVSGVEGEGQAV